MPNDTITFQDSGYFTPIVVDYLAEKSSLKSLYNRFPTIENFEDQIQEKIANFSENEIAKKNILVEVLEKQYSKVETSDATLNNINSLKNSSTFTITTGHQLNLFTGPMYFLYKIISTINLCKQLQVQYPQQNFVPVYWMATEDHDFEEINYFTANGKKFRWNKESLGAVGRLSTDGMQEVFEIFSKELGAGNNASYIRKLFEQSYLKHANLADATQYLANELFGKYGLVVLNADNRQLKKLFVPVIKEELLQQKSFEKVNETIAKLQDYAIQVNPREINLFYLKDNLRERIVLENSIYKINNTQIIFTEREILQELDDFPERFSPNVILRPLYQEVILPNLCYIGGGGEIAYWLELKSTFDYYNVTFPILLLRNSVLLATAKQIAKIDKLALTWQDLFLKQNDLINQQTIKKTVFEIDFVNQKTVLEKQFNDLYEIAKLTDKSFLGAVKAQEFKQLKGLDNLEKRLLKAQKRVLADDLIRIVAMQNELFPNESLQERTVNFSEFYIEFGNELIDVLIKKLNPLSDEFDIIVL